MLARRGEVLMAKFGRFGFGKDEPSETYEGDRMTVGNGYVKIIRLLEVAQA